MPNVIATTIYFKTHEEKQAALDKAEAEDKSLSKLVRELLRKHRPRKTNA